MKDAWDLMRQLVLADKQQRQADDAAKVKRQTANTLARQVIQLREVAANLLASHLEDGQCFEFEGYCVEFDVDNGLTLKPMKYVSLMDIPLTPEPIPAELASWSKHDPDGTLHEAAQAFHVDQTV